MLRLTHMKKKSRIGKKKTHRAVRNTVLALFSLGFAFTGVFVIWVGTLNLPDFKSFEQRRISESTKIYDRTGTVLLYDVHDETKRTVVPYDEISIHIKNATVAIEDAEFYEHKGVKPVAFLRAVFANLSTLSLGQGGSTITQQVVKNTLLTPEKKISRKIKEWVLALKLERALGKEEILALYLNESPYGGSIYGIEQASLAFFGKNAKDLTLAESAYLAALPQAPTFYSPYGNNTDKLEERKNLVLKKMLENGFIDETAYNEAVKTEVVFLPQDPIGIKAPHFVVWVREQLVKKYGEKTVQEGGLKVTTTIDYALQQKAEEIVKKYAEENEEKFNAKNAGMVAIDPANGNILVMVGSRDYFDTENEGNFNTTIAPNRQPGSVFKPFVYATAFMKGYLPETVVFDLQTQFQVTCDAKGKPLYSEVDPDDCYMPQNYDETFRGPVSLREALAQSMNIPAIKTLYLAGLADSFETAKKMGVKSLTDPNRYGLTLVLGGGEVSLIDITSAYGVFANEGKRVPYTGILKVEDRNGNVLEEHIPQPKQVIDEKIAAQISDILSDNEARAPAFGARSPLYFEGYDVAAKTGTTNDYRDAWIIGYTPSFVLGAWAGNNDNSSMEKKVAGFVVAPMWREFMQVVLPTLPEESFASVPAETNPSIKPVLRGFWRGNEQYFIDRISGKRATEYTPKELREERVVTNIHSILYWVDKNNPRGEAPSDPERDPQFNLWEEPVREWVEKQGFQEESLEDIPAETDDIHTPQNRPVVSVISPVEANTYGKNDRIMIRTEHSTVFPVARIEAFLNNVFIGSIETAPFQISFVPEEVGAVQGENTLRVVVYDSVLNKTSVTQSFFVE